MYEVGQGDNGNIRDHQNEHQISEDFVEFPLKFIALLMLIAFFIIMVIAISMSSSDKCRHNC